MIKRLSHTVTNSFKNNFDLDLEDELLYHEHVLKAVGQLKPEHMYDVPEYQSPQHTLESYCERLSADYSIGTEHRENENNGSIFPITKHTENSKDICGLSRLTLNSESTTYPLSVRSAERILRICRSDLCPFMLHECNEKKRLCPVHSTLAVLEKSRPQKSSPNFNRIFKSSRLRKSNIDHNRSSIKEQKSGLVW